MKCDECKYYDGWGRCRRNPPVVINVSDEVKSVFPEIAHDDWCGEFVQKLMTALQLE